MRNMSMTSRGDICSFTADGLKLSGDTANRSSTYLSVASCEALSGSPATVVGEP